MLSNKKLSKFFTSQKAKIPTIGIGTAYMSSNISEIP